MTIPATDADNETIISNDKNFSAGDDLCFYVAYRTHCALYVMDMDATTKQVVWQLLQYITTDSNACNFCDYTLTAMDTTWFDGPYHVFFNVTAAFSFTHAESRHLQTLLAGLQVYFTVCVDSRKISKQPFKLAPIPSYIYMEQYPLVADSLMIRKLQQ